jgi:actin-related protein 6
MNSMDNTSSLTFVRPFDKGYIVNMACEIEIWKYCLNKKFPKAVVPKDSALVLTEPPCTPVCIQNDYNEVVFEEFGFDRYMRRPASWFAAYEFAHINEYMGGAGEEGAGGSTGEVPLYTSYDVTDTELLETRVEVRFPRALTVMDSGFSFTHFMPFLDLRCKQAAIRRMNIGGKFLTNYLKEIVSYRQWNMMDEFALINSAKERLCFVSDSYAADIRDSKTKAVTTLTLSNKLASKRRPVTRRVRPSVVDREGTPLRKSYVLPDFQTIMQPYVKPDGERLQPHEQVLAMETERISVPELLFCPTDIGLSQSGLPETCHQSLDCLPEVEMRLCGQNVLCVGGNVLIPGLAPRFARELRQFVPDSIPLRVHVPKDPVSYSWKGASRFARDEVLPGLNSPSSAAPTTPSGSKRQAVGAASGAMVTRQEYLENGHHYCNEKMNSW